VRGNGTERQFDTPPLEPGFKYFYTLKASWLQDGERITLERQVQVMPGQATVVDFTRPPSQANPPPKKDAPEAPE
jgi:uncharacterized protein (TIGR03000 family)